MSAVCASDSALALTCLTLRLVPADFIAPVETHNPTGQHHDILLSNFFAQPE